MCGRQVLDDYKCHAGVRRQCSQQLRERFKAAGRCADTHDGEWCFTILADPRLRGLPVVPAFRTAAIRPPGFLRHSYLRNGHYPPVKRDYSIFCSDKSMLRIVDASASRPAAMPLKRAAVAASSLILA